MPEPAAHIGIGSVVQQTWGQLAYPLGQNLSLHRSRHHRGQLSAQRTADLDALGLIWDPVHEQWENRLAAVREHQQAHGTLPTNTDRQRGQPPFNAYQWLTRERRLQRDGQLPAQRADRLSDALGPGWSQGEREPRAARRSPRQAPEPNGEHPAALAETLPFPPRDDSAHLVRPTEKNSASITTSDIAGDER